MDRVGRHDFLRAIFLSVFLISGFCRSEDTIDCSNKCSLDGDDLDCWQGTENFLLNQLVETINNLTKAEFMIDKWRTEHDQIEAINDTVADLVQRVNSMGMNDGPLNSTYVDDIINYTVTQILEWAQLKLNHSSEVTYEIHCPVPDDYVNTLWIYMFVCSCIIMLLMLIYVIIHVHKLKGGIKKQKRLI